MGGVSALMAIGLFDIMGTQSQQPVYEITSPVFDEITILLDPKYYAGKSLSLKPTTTVLKIVILMLPG